jgi:hypothetical protein
MKIKIFHNESALVVEDSVNAFIADKRVLDIQYSIVPSSTVPGVFEHSVCISYEVNDTHCRDYISGVMEVSL